MKTIGEEARGAEEGARMVVEFVCVAREGGGSGVEDAFPVCVPVCKCQVVRDVQQYLRG